MRVVYTLVINRNRKLSWEVLHEHKLMVIKVKDHFHFYILEES